MGRRRPLYYTTADSSSESRITDPQMARVGLTEAAARTAVQCCPRLDDSSQPGALYSRRGDIRGLVKLVADAVR